MAEDRHFVLAVAVNGFADIVIVVHGVKAEFLADELVRKIRTSSEAAGSKTSWMIYNWTGTTGKDDVTAALKDAGAYDID